ncbi:uncharacterized protein LOC134026372 [Osmerus eperlanus]|uniref:uncharacterized protein LOC134026372 n=1 Tax=Osmerus eperlanus TaxID=29151 RepID=UPI002E0EB5FE
MGLLPSYTGPLGSVFLFLCAVCCQRAQEPLKPRLTMSPAVIGETDSVLLSCETPPFLPVSQCYIDIGQQNPLRACHETLTGTTILTMTGQKSPAEVTVTCYYYATWSSTQSPLSDPVTVTIQDHLKRPETGVNDESVNVPVLTVHRGENIIITCSFPGSATTDTKCDLYIGEEKKTFITTKTSNQQWFCQFFVSENDLLRRLQHVLLKEVSCDYRVGPKLNLLSPRSDGYSLRGMMIADSGDAVTIQTPTETSGSTTTFTQPSERHTFSLTDGTTTPSDTTKSSAVDMMVADSGDSATVKTPTAFSGSTTTFTQPSERHIFSKNENNQHKPCS